MTNVNIRKHNNGKDLFRCVLSQLLEIVGITDYNGLLYSS